MMIRSASPARRPVVLALLIMLPALLPVAAGCGDRGPRPVPAATGPATAAPESDVDAPRDEEAAPPDRAPEAPDSPDSPGTPRPADPEPAPPAPPAPPAAPIDPMKLYSELLSALVTETGLVRYDRLVEPAVAAKLDTVIAAIAAAPLPDTPNARFALWCNAYNANVIRLAFQESRSPGFKTVKDVPGFFDRKMITVAGRPTTLNDLENKRLRPLGDARVHAALVCAAMSCPPLRAEPFEAARLEEQLDDQCRRWINDPAKFRVDAGVLELNEILKWYGADFTGSPFGSPTGFVLAYAKPDGPLVRLIVNSDPVRTSWIPYDWTLNRAPIP